MQQRIKSITRRGAASFYVVIFAALVFTVIVLSFIRLMISESSQNISDDLSQSAYDSALAGVEDAKAAISICQENPSAAGCDQLYSDDCNRVSQILYGDTDGAVSTSADQSYTCVKLAKDLPDYRVFLTAEEATKVIKISNSKKVRISWFSATDLQSAGDKFSDGYYNNAYLLSAPETTPPVVSASTIETGSDHLNTVILRPSNKSAGTNNTTNPQAAYDTAHSQNGVNKAAVVKCDTTKDFACSVEISTNNNVEYLVLSLPYRETRVSFKVEKFNTDGTVGLFDSQISVDSTGRANNYYRRVDSRLQLSDIHFPYPDYALRSSDGSAGVSKNFWVTTNCWHATNGTVSTSAPCNNQNSGTL